MKPAPFRYLAPTTLDEAVDVLSQFGDEAKLLAGGQSLIPTMNFRLAQPGVLIDLNRIPTLGYIERAATGGLRIGAMTRQRQVEQSPLVAQRVPLLSAAMPLIAHVQIRNRGTIGGSLAHADPAAELPAVVSALGGTLVVCGPGGERRIEVSDFYVGLFATGLAPDEVLTEIELPSQPQRSGFAIQEIVRRQGDYALAGIAVHVEVDGEERCSAARMVYFGVGDGPVVALGAANLLVGERPTVALIEAAAEAAAKMDLDPSGDIHASVKYRRHLAQVLGRRALREAFGRAGVVLK
ncbi:MAG: xanthine dehydrogenase family protein subunit M [Caldilineaceae bacterium]|nr:xanthine dehydrogenase family protein subunit M [Caldilineaceae bacterium]